MDPVTAKLMSAAGAAADPVYVDDVFSTFLYEGNGTSQTINNGIDVSGEGALVWIRNRNASSGADHIFTDTERGTNTVLESNRARAAQTKTDMITSFTSTGFAVADNGHVNENNDDICSWTFRKAPGFFDVVTYTGTGSVQNISHSLGSVPGSIWIKSLGSQAWTVTHRSTGWNYYLELNDNLPAQQDSSIHNSTAPTASVFTLGDGSANYSGTSYVAYIFAHDEQSFGEGEDEAIIKCGSVTGDSNGDFTVDLGFEPQWLLTKWSDATGNWTIHDTMRGFGVNNRQELFANTNGAEVTQSNTNLTITSTGFVGDDYQQFNKTLVYIAIRRPHKPPEAGTDVFKPNTYTGNGSLLSITGIGFPPDFSFTTRRDTASWITTDRLRGPSQSLFAQSTDAQVNQGIYEVRSYDQDGITYGQNSSVNGSGVSLVHYLFRRAPGFFDVVAFTGNGLAQSINHNLGVAPELLIVKSASSNVNSGWTTYSAPTGNNNVLRLNYDSAAGGTSGFQDTTPTSTQFFLEYYNASGVTFVAYLFATLPGISKVGTFSGTGSDINVDCGFTAGARFVMIKRTDSSGDWYVFDSARGIVSGNDPYLRLNSTGAEVTNTDYIDPLNAGFKVTALYNQSEVWSGYPKTGTQPAGAEWTKAFDGNLANGVYPNTNITTTLTIDVSDRPTWSSSIRIYGVNYGGVVTINGTNVTSATSGSLGWFDLTSLLGSSGTLASFSLTNPGGNYAKINAVELDGKQLVDTGVSVTPSPVNTSGGTYIFLAIA